MSTTNASPKEADDRGDECENDWCAGPASETLPCFDCFDPAHDYDLQRLSGAEPPVTSTDESPRAGDNA
jgi:hypothetical protein